MADDLPRVYLAGPLFTQAERRWNAELAAALTAKGFQMLVPQVLAEALITETGLGVIRIGGHLPYGGYDAQTDGRHTDATCPSPVH